MKTLNIRVIIFVLTDANGNTEQSASDRVSGDFSLGGYGTDGFYHIYSSKSNFNKKPVNDWAKEHGMRFDVYEKIFPLDIL